jgi:probable F420-dependent oxidoreductase
MDIKKLGVWAATDSFNAAEAAKFAQRVEAWGYGALWYPEAFGRNSLVHASWLLSQTRTLVLASGIANIYARDAWATESGRRTLDEQSGGRFLCGLGVSHLPMVEGMRGHDYSKPLTKMRTYLEAMAKTQYGAPAPAQNGELILAALAPKMLALSAERADGAHPYNVNPEHTARARAILGPGKRLYPEQLVILETDADKARQAAKKFLALYLTLPNYCNAWVSLGFSEQEIQGCADRFIDSIAAWGDEQTIRRRLEEHWQAGADHICIQAISSQDGSIDEEALALFAPAR